MHNKEIIQLDDSLLYGQGSHKNVFYILIIKIYALKSPTTKEGKRILFVK